MVSLRRSKRPRETDLLVAFFDLTHYARFARSHTSREVLDMLSAYYELVGDIVEEGGGMVVKFIGDAGLLVYPPECVDRGVLSLRKLKQQGDAWLEARKLPCRNVIKAHFGAVACGPVGTRKEKRFDVFGDTVNATALLKSDGLALTAQAFRKLKKETRTFFKRHPTPATYIPVEQRHKG